MTRRGRLIVLEGPDKSGKSTHAALLMDALRRRGLKTLHTREPGGTSFAEAVREILLDPRNKVHPLSELLLYEAARAQHTQELLLPALRGGKTIVCERYTLATLAYQGFGRGLPLPLVRRLNAAATSGLRADLTLVLDIPDARFLDRATTRKLDRLELESRRFRLTVARAYRRLARTEPRTVLIDADRPKAAVHEEILERVLNVVSRKETL
ncbi:MAG: dTMP kinase [Elusimicrobiota bacterium]